MRRITTGLVFTLSATCSDFRGSSPDQAIKLRTCTATAKRLLVDISKHGSQLGKQFCNHYSYNFDFVNYLSRLDFFGAGDLFQREVQVVDEVEEDVDVDGFRDEGDVADGEGFVAVFVARIPRDRNRRNALHSRKLFQLLEKLVAVDIRHADIGNDDVRPV